jgi:hypothetical protein
MIEGPTQALRENSPVRLRTELLRMLEAYDAKEHEPEIRDVLWSLAPYHDCSRRLGLDPSDFFDGVADAGPSRLRNVVRDFGRRTDTSPEAFGGYAVVETSEGPSYIWSY